MPAPGDFIRIRSAWDRTLTYDCLERQAAAAEDETIFVGRESLLDPLIEAIADPETRGTFLISGYRGAGKTTLLIEALRRAKAILEERRAPLAASPAEAVQVVAGTPKSWRLLPLVLNVSELSASLRTEVDGAAPSLSIDPRRLLTALLRALMNRAAQLPAQAAVRDKIADTYNKASAAEYSRTTSAGREEARSVESESTLSFEVRDLYKLAGALAAGGVVVLEALAWLGPTAAAVHAAAVVLAATSVAAFKFSQKQTRREADKRELKTSLRFDNSLHQIETDLKDILAELHANSLRPVVVLEELDKLDDGEGKQLDAVIRYFKNLFTQAPGLFFFVTDKGYFDLVSSRIKKARRLRSYAVEHTFFTHRIFVGRPSTADCVSYLQRIAGDADGLGRVAQYGGAMLASRSAEAAADRLLLLIGAVLFRAANHLFDLKNELRPYVRRIAVGEVGETRLTFDGQSLSDEEAAQAKFQALIEMKARQYAFSPGRPYANEVLNDCLYALFNELGSSRTQSVSDFYPRRRSDLLLDEQLDITEADRIKEAVDSLAEDLQRGGAFNRDRKDVPAGQFVWKAAAARGFRFVRRLETYEEDFINELSRLSAQASRFGKTGRFAAIEGIVDADQVAQAIEDRIGEIRDLSHSLGFEDAQIEKLGFADRVHQVVDQAFAKLLQRLQGQYGLPVRLRQTQGAQGVYVVGAGSDGLGRASATDTGALLLVLGEAPEMEATVHSLIATGFGVERLALVHVIDDRGQPTSVENWLQKWNKVFAAVAAELAGSQPPIAMPNCRVRVIALGEPYIELELKSLDAPPTLEQAWGEQAMCEIMFEAPWVNPAWPRLGSLSALRAGRVPATHTGLIAAFDEWLGSSDQLFWFRPLPTDEPALAAPAGDLEAWLERRDAPDVFVVNVQHAIEAPFASSSIARLRIAQHLHASVRDMQASEATFARAAAIGVATRRLIPGVHLPDVQKAEPEALAGLRALVGTPGRLVLASDTVPGVFSDMTRQEYDTVTQP